VTRWFSVNFGSVVRSRVLSSFPLALCLSVELLPLLCWWSYSYVSVLFSLFCPKILASRHCSSVWGVAAGSVLAVAGEFGDPIAGAGGLFVADGDVDVAGVVVGGGDVGVSDV